MRGSQKFGWTNGSTSITTLIQVALTLAYLAQKRKNVSLCIDCFAMTHALEGFCMSLYQLFSFMASGAHCLYQIPVNIYLKHQVLSILYNVVT